MFVKIVFVCYFISIVYGAAVPPKDELYDHHADYYARPKYHYKYGVEDLHSGDHKTHHEERDGDAVKGEYSVVQPDGVIRTVHYTADHHNGYNAVVTYSGHPIKTEPEPEKPKYISKQKDQYRASLIN